MFVPRNMYMTIFSFSKFSLSSAIALNSFFCFGNVVVVFLHAYCDRLFDGLYWVLTVSVI